LVLLLIVSAIGQAVIGHAVFGHAVIGRFVRNAAD
jgi:hypothetical protein